jgi:hypothetical protein
MRSALCPARLRLLPQSALLSREKVREALASLMADSGNGKIGSVLTNQ